MRHNLWMIVALTACATSVLLLAPAQAEAFYSKHGKHGWWSASEHPRAMSLRINAGRLSLASDDLDIDGIADLGGLGLTWRWELFRDSGPEVSLAGYRRTSQDSTLRESSGTVSVSWIRHF